MADYMEKNIDLDLILDLIEERNIENDLFGKEIKAAVTDKIKPDIFNMRFMQQVFQISRWFHKSYEFNSKQEDGLLSQ